MSADRNYRSRLPWHWGVAPPSHHAAAPCPSATRTLLTRASAESLMLWISQLRRGPYSYDWIDNLGRRSPRTPDNKAVHTGDRLMYIFTVSATGPRHVQAEMTTLLPRKVFGPVRIRYEVHDYGTVRGIEYTMWTPGRGRVGRIRSFLLAWADLIMARKQLFTLAKLAEEAYPGEYDRSIPTKE